MTEIERIVKINDITIDLQMTPETVYINIHYPRPNREHTRTCYSSQAQPCEVKSEIESMLDWLAETGEIVT